MAQGIRVKDLDIYEGELNRDDLSIPVDAEDFVSGKRITGQQLKNIIGNRIDNKFQDLSESVSEMQHDIDEMQDVVNSMETWTQGW